MCAYARTHIPGSHALPKVHGRGVTPIIQNTSYRTLYVAPTRNLLPCTCHPIYPSQSSWGPLIVVAHLRRLTTLPRRHYLSVEDVRAWCTGSLCRVHAAPLLSSSRLPPFPPRYCCIYVDRYPLRLGEEQSWASWYLVRRMKEDQQSACDVLDEGVFCRTI